MDKQTQTQKQKQTHTPGPWVAHGRNVSVEGRDIEFPVAQVTDILHEAEAFANARLIAAAPDLLEALRGCVEQLGHYLLSVESGKDDDAESAYQYGMAMIAKAEGNV